MFALDEKTRFYLCRRPVSMRYGIKGLTNLVLTFPGFSPMSGCAFVFFSADRRQVKILRWDGDGFLLYQKKIARGRFRELVYKGAEGCLCVSYEEMYFLKRGVSPVTMKVEKRFRQAPMEM